jgi:hypothetical protein
LRKNLRVEKHLETWNCLTKNTKSESTVDQLPELFEEEPEVEKLLKLLEEESQTLGVDKPRGLLDE